MKHNLSGHAALIVDTNLFLECRALSHIPWYELGFSSIDLIVTRPVQQELDAHKKNVRGRTFKKALAAGQQLRELVTSGDDVLVINNAEPRVTLTLMQASRIEPDLEPALIPQINDDAIILRMLQFKRDNEGVDVHLLTHDTGPMATAKSLSLPFIPIPDTFLLAEQDDASAKEIKKLQAEVKRLQAQEPTLVIKACDNEGNEIKRIHMKMDYFEPLAPAEIDTIMAGLEAKFPMATDFGSPDTTPKPEFPAVTRQITVTQFKPATEAEIEKYRDERYPEWVSDCHEFLENLHHRLNARVELPAITFIADNTGTRPASQALTRFMALGDLEIQLPSKDSSDDDDKPSGKSSDIRLPRPPSPPRGEWISSRRGISTGLSAMMMGRSHDPFGAHATRLSPLDILPAHPKPRDPDSFYWRDGRPSYPKTEIALTCENWRHGVDPEEFDFLIVPAARGTVAGAIKCEIHAGNLTAPVQVTVPVTINQITRSTLDVASKLVECI